MHFPNRASVSDLLDLIRDRQNSDTDCLIRIAGNGRVSLVEVPKGEGRKAQFEMLFLPDSIFTLDPAGMVDNREDSTDAVDPEWLKDTHTHLVEAWERFTQSEGQD